MRLSGALWRVEGAAPIPLLAILAAILVEPNDQVSWSNGAALAPTFCVPSPEEFPVTGSRLKPGVDVAPIRPQAGTKLNDEDF